MWRPFRPPAFSLARCRGPVLDSPGKQGYGGRHLSGKTIAWPRRQTGLWPDPTAATQATSWGRPLPCGLPGQGVPAKAALRKSCRMLSPAQLALTKKRTTVTGPQTIAGSRTSSMNATRHGLSATSVVVIQGVENEAEYEALVADVIADLKPMGAVERLLAERVAQLFWRLRRVLRLKTGVCQRPTVEGRR